MSKAFVKEGDGNGPEDDLEVQSGPRLPQGTKNYVTPQGEAKLREELSQLIKVERPKMVEVVQWAASLGDRSENADYIYGKKRLREIDRRIRFLQKRLDNVEIVDPLKVSWDTVRFGATVTILNEEDEQKTFKIVGIDETDASKGKISWISPMGKALLKAKVGDVVILRSPKGEEDLEILKIEYVAIE